MFRLQSARFFGVVALAIAAAARAADSPPTPQPARPKISNEQIATLVGQLDHRSYAIREAATQRLIEAGKPAVDRLVEAAERGSPELIARAMAILETLYLSGADDASEASETALERLAGSKNRSAAGRATSVLTANQTFRLRRALQRVVELGGVVKDPLGDTIDIQDQDALGRKIPSLHLGTAWKGGDEGLRHVKRLTNLELLYVIDGCGVSDQALEDVHRALPNLRAIEKRGPAYLGIGGTSHQIACLLITSVREGSPAARAGIKEAAILLQFGGDPVPDVRSLGDRVGTKEAGSKVPVVVQHDAEIRTLEVTLEPTENGGTVDLGIDGKPHKLGCLVVSSVNLGSAADRAGLQPKDILLQFDGVSLQDFRALIGRIGTKKPGDKVRIVMQRDGETRTLEVTLNRWQ